MKSKVTSPGIWRARSARKSTAPFKTPSRTSVFAARQHFGDDFVVGESRCVRSVVPALCHDDALVESEREVSKRKSSGIKPPLHKATNRRILRNDVEYFNEGAVASRDAQGS